VAFREQAVRECLDTISVLRSYREPLDGEGWLVPAASERRLLAQVNAIVALGRDALKQVIALSLDADVPDSGRVFAGLLVLGCTEGREWLGPAREIFVSSTLRNADESAAAVEALSLCPNPEVPTLLSPLLDDERPPVRAASIRVLGFRDALAEARWMTAVRDDSAVVVKAALTVPLRRYDRNVCRRVVELMIAQSDAESIVRLALRAGVTIRSDATHDFAAQIARTDPSWAEAGECLALFGQLDDVRQVREMLDGSGLQNGLRAAAILGSLEIVPDLLELLDRRDAPPETSGLARQALTTITGLDFAVTTDAIEALSLWSAHSHRFDPRFRYRNGSVLTLETMLQLLRTGSGLRKVRQDVYLEMQAATESRVPRFSSYDFVSVQAQSLRHIELWLRDLQVPAISSMSIG
jgi:hypothetical protein